MKGDDPITRVTERLLEDIAMCPVATEWWGDKACRIADFEDQCRQMAKYLYAKGWRCHPGEMP